MKTFAICFILYAIPMITPAQLVVILKIEGIDKLGGKIHVSIFNSEETYNQRDVFHSFILDAKHEALNKALDLPSGSYVFSIYQDRNGNNKLDTNLIGLLALVIITGKTHQVALTGIKLKLQKVTRR